MRKAHKNLSSLVIIIIIIILAIYLFSKNGTQAPAPQESASPSASVTTAPISQPVVAAPETPSATVGVTSPNGGEKLDINKSVTVTWNYTGLAVADTISISLLSDKNEMCWVGRSAVGNKRYDFTASSCSTPNNPLKLGKYKIQITVDKFANGKGVADTSDAYFDIVQAF